MRNNPNSRIEQHRDFSGGAPMGSGSNGQFSFKRSGGTLFVVASSEGGWEHVSVSVRRGSAPPSRCPTWNEMSWIKRQFWADNETVIQYHPAAEDYVDCHPFVLHLWRPIGVELPKPPPEMVGVGWGEDRR